MNKNINEILESEYTYCKKCKKYYSNKDFKVEEVEEIRSECTFCDGDDYEYSNIKYDVIYRICPNCHEKRKIKEQKKQIVDSFSGNYYT